MTTSGSDEIDESWGFRPDMTPEERRELIRAYAEEDEIDEDPDWAERERDEIALIRAEKELVTMLGTRSFDTLPAAVRKLYRQNPNDPSIRGLYDATLRELYERTDDKLRGALLPAVDKMVDLIDSKDPAIAFRAATYVFERLRGKTPDVIEHRQDKPFQVILERIVSGPRMAASERTALPGSEDAIEAEVVAETHTAPRQVEAAKKPARRSRKTVG